jgi:hypothetical protein
MIVDVLAIYARGKNSEGNNLYSVQINVDGKNHTLCFVREGEPGDIQTFNPTDSRFFWELFTEDHFYLACIPRLLIDFLAGYRPRFPMRLVEAGDGARYLREEPDPT